MFDEVFDMARQCECNFRDGVRDSFGLSVVSEILEPICREIASLRSFHDDFQRQSVNIEQILEETRSFHFYKKSDG